MKQSIFRIITFLFMMLILIPVLYYGVLIIKARAETPKIAEEILAAAKVTFPGLTKEKLDALLKIEDPEFFSHRGIDLKTPGAGLTTITQGIGKKIYFKKFRPGIRKIKLMLLSRFALDPCVSKEDQLTIFMNVIYMGRGKEGPVTGFAGAAREYFKKEFTALSYDEYLSLVAMVIAPNNFHVINRPKSNKKRVERMKKVISGQYKPKGLMDLYYGELEEEEKDGLAPASYFEKIY